MGRVFDFIVVAIPTCRVTEDFVRGTHFPELDRISPLVGVALPSTLVIGPFNLALRGVHGDSQQGVQTFGVGVHLNKDKEKDKGGCGE